MSGYNHEYGLVERHRDGDYYCRPRRRRRYDDCWDHGGPIIVRIP
ncbi:hypothetical protein [Cryptosporangium sp. NPDC051539]